MIKLHVIKLVYISVQYLYEYSICKFREYLKVK